MFNDDTKIKVGILRGGKGEHYVSSLRKGGEIISHISENLSDKYKIIDIFIDKKDGWHVNGIPISFSDLAHKIDVIWDISRDPSLSVMLDNLAIPKVGNGSFLGILENNSDMLKTHVRSFGIQMPRSILLSLYQKDFDGPRERYAIKKAKEVFEKFSAPWIIKSFTPDFNMGIHLAKTFGELVEAIEDGVTHEKSILVEEFIAGKIASAHSVSGFRGEDIYVFPPENFITSEKEKIITFIKDLHRFLGVEHYLKSNFVLHPKKGFFLTSIDFLPDLRKDSHFDQSCQFVGAKMHHIIGHILEKALDKGI